VTQRVVVVGGGLSGASAALRAADQGADVVVLELRNRLGGLTWSFRRRGLWFDNGQHVFLRCCTEYLEFLARIGSRELVTIQPRLDVAVLAPGGRSASISRSSLPVPLHLLGTLLRYRHLGLRSRLRALRAADALRHVRLEDPGLDAETFAEWLERHGQDPPTIDRLWNLIALPTLNVDARDGSMALAAKVFKTGLLDAADAGDIGWSAVPLRALHGDRISAALERTGVEQHLGTRVRSVRRGTSARYEVVADEGTWDADAVVVATPPDVASRVLPAGVLGDVTGLGTSPIVNVHLVLDRKVTDLAFAAVVDSPLQFVFDRTTSSGLGHGQYLAVSVSAADALVGRHPSALVDDFLGALGEVFPMARRARLLDATVSVERAATFRGVPGTAALRPPARTSLEGLALAGAWCATGWPATMEGAVRSGRTAADVALAAGRTASSPGVPRVLEEVE
jgi:squalene-associated FAD-dependent desaturase